MEPNVPGTKLPSNTAYSGPHRHLKRRTLRRFDSICGNIPCRNDETRVRRKPSISKSDRLGDLCPRGEIQVGKLLGCNENFDLQIK